MKLSEREIAILRVLTADGTKAEREECERGMYAGRIGWLAFPELGYSQRRDAGTTRTLDSMQRKGLTRSKYDRQMFGMSGSRRWWVTEDGRAALAEWAFGD